MKKALLGLFSLLALSFVIGVGFHWALGLMTFLVPVAVVYIRVKASAQYRAACDQRLARTFETKH